MRPFTHVLLPAMHILLVNDTRLPVHAYGTKERVVWWLGEALAKRGHTVSLLAPRGSKCSFGDLQVRNPTLPLADQIPEACDVVHIHEVPDGTTLPKPTIYSYHENNAILRTFPANTVFASKDHARRHGGAMYVHYGLQLDEYGKPDLTVKRRYCHFLGNANRRIRNIRGAIAVASEANMRLHVMGGARITFRSGMRITISPNVRFHGAVSGDGKNMLLNASKGLIFPLIWHDPFALAVAESLYFGCPLFGTPYGALPEMLGYQLPVGRIQQGGVEAIYCDLGCLSTKKSDLVEAVLQADDYSAQACHDFAAEYYSAQKMTDAYLALYEQVLNGRSLHAQDWTYTPNAGDEAYLPFK